MGKSGSKLQKRKKHQKQIQQQQELRQRRASTGSGQPSSITASATAFTRQSQLSRSCQDLESRDDQQTERQLLRALFHFDAQVDGDLSIQKGDLLEVVNSDDKFWILARSLSTEQAGYVPRNYVQVIDGTPQALDCWFNVDRREAERNLLLPGNPAGCYLLRPCHQAANQAHFTLSVRAEDLDNGGDRRVQVKHYMVRQNSSGHVFIDHKLIFASIEQLLQHYKQQASGLCCALISPCPRDWQPPAQLRDFEVNRQALIKVKLLGQGSFGEVWQAKLNRLVDVAVKLMKPGAMDKESFLDEARLHYKLHHPKVVQLLGVCTAQEPMYIITEYMPNGSLNQYLRADRINRQITLSDMTDMMYQIADGMAYLANSDVVHRDLRAANILVGIGNVVKVSDFGLSRCLREESSESKIKFPVRWTAPEAARSKSFNTKSDVWSFGILMFEIVSRSELPYKDLPNKDVIPKVSEGYRLPNPTDTDDVECDDYLYDVMLHCWAANPDERPSFDALRNMFESYSNDSDHYCRAIDRRNSNFSITSAA